MLRGTREQYVKVEEVNIHLSHFAGQLNDCRNCQRLNREICTWRDLSHPNVTELLGIATLNPDLPPGLVSRWVQRHNFLEYIGRHPELKRRKV